jgi:putative membrane protein
MTKASAHTLDGAGPIQVGWSFEPWVLIPLILTALLYAIGSVRLHRQGTADRRLDAALFWSGLATLAVALVSPLHALGTHAFTAHMIEHELLMVAAAPLLIAARPAAALLWGLPHQLRPAAAGLGRPGPIRRLWARSTELWSATALHAAVLWIWHLPVLFKPVLASEGVHTLQHASFLISALMFWTAVLRPGAHAQGAKIMALFFTSLQAGLLGALLTFSRVLWYPFAPDPFPICGLTRFEDQALAGLVMWIPACGTYVVAALVLMALWLSALENRHASA